MKAMKKRPSATLCSYNQSSRVPCAADVIAETPAEIDTDTVST